MRTFEKTLAMEDFTRGNHFRTAKPCILIRLGGHLQKSVAYPVRLSVHFSRLDMLTPTMLMGTAVHAVGVLLRNSPGQNQQLHLGKSKCFSSVDSHSLQRRKGTTKKHTSTISSGIAKQLVEAIAHDRRSDLFLR